MLTTVNVLTDNMDGHVKIQKPQNLCLSQWNCRSITNKAPIFQKWLDENGSDVILLQSLAVKANSLPRLNGYYYPPVYVEDFNQKVQVATYVSTKLNYDVTTLPDPQSLVRLYRCAITIAVKGCNPLNIVNVYYPDGIPNGDKASWLESLDNSREWIIGGDFNCRHLLWDPTADPSSCVSFCNSLIDSGLSCLNDGSFTRLGQVGQTDTAIDLTLATPCIAIDALWATGNDELQSDHLPIRISLNKTPCTVENTSTSRYNCKKADWSKFQTAIDNEAANITSNETDIELKYDLIRKCILNAAEKSIPKKGPIRKGPNFYSAVWWNSDCDSAVASKRRALRLFQVNRTVENKQTYVDAAKACRQTLEDSKKSHWLDFCTREVKNHRDMGKVWKKIKSLKRHPRLEQSLLVNGKQTINDKEKADALANTFAQVSQSEYLPKDIAKFRADSENLFVEPPKDNFQSFNADFTLSELRSAIKHLNTSGKATGQDPISYEMIRHLPDSLLSHLLQLFQVCWSHGSIPFAWKQAQVIGIPKEGKPRNLASNYRPISLLPHLSKLYERVVTDRLTHYLEKNNLIPLQQAGFRKGRCAVEHIVRLVEHAKKNLSHNRTTFATFFDIKKAFDTVWHAKLLQKLNNLGISGRLYDFIKTFLSDRSIVVKVGGSMSDVFHINMGVPQGSVISPILFVVMLHDIHQAVSKPNFYLSMFADDVAIWSSLPGNSSYLRKKWLVSFQEVVTSIEQYMSLNGFQLAAEKTSSLVFTRFTSTVHEYSIKIADKVILPSKSVKFLGVTIQQNLSWTDHVAVVVAKASRAVNLIRMISREDWVTPHSLITLTTSLVRSRLAYGLEACLTMTDSQWLQLERSELAALKTALGISRFAINNLTYQEAGLLPLREEVALRAAIFQARTKTTQTSAIAETSFDFAPPDSVWRDRLKKNPTIYSKTASLPSVTHHLWEASDISPVVVDRNPKPFLPPWQQKSAFFDLSYVSFSKLENPLYLTSIAKEKISTEFPHHLQVYTDGSLSEDKHAGCAFVIPDLGITKKYKLNDNVSVFSTELFALLMATSFVVDLPKQPLAVLFLSDSKSALQALERGGTFNRSAIQQDILHNIHQLICRGINTAFMWIPSHTGIRGNDLADQAAKQATKNCELPVQNLGLSLSEVKSRLKNAAIALRLQKLNSVCLDHGWLYFPSVKIHTPKLPRRFIQIICRLRTLSSPWFFKTFRCGCGQQISLHHIVSSCGHLPPSFDAVKDLVRVHNLKTHQFLCLHDKLGDKPMRVLSGAIVASELSKLF